MVLLLSLILRRLGAVYEADSLSKPIYWHVYADMSRIFATYSMPFCLKPSHTWACL